MAKEEFARIIVLINSTNAMECDFLNNPEYGVDAALWIGYTGSYGLNAVADILVDNGLGSYKKRSKTACSTQSLHCKRQEG